MTESRTTKSKQNKKCEKIDFYLYDLKFWCFAVPLKKLSLFKKIAPMAMAMVLWCTLSRSSNKLCSLQLHTIIFTQPLIHNHLYTIKNKKKKMYSLLINNKLLMMMNLTLGQSLLLIKVRTMDTMPGDQLKDEEKTWQWKNLN